MAARLKSIVVVSSVGLVLLFVGGVKGAERGLGAAAGERYAAVEYSDAADLLKGKFNPKQTVSIKYCEKVLPPFNGLEKLFPAEEEGGASGVRGGEQQSFGAAGTLSCQRLDESASYRTAGAAGNETKRAAPVEQRSNGRSTSEILGSARIFGFIPYSDSAAYDFEAVGGYDRPKLQFTFTLNRYSPDGVSLPFITGPANIRDNSMPHDEIASYYGLSKGLFLPAQTRSSAFSHGWRLGEGPTFEQYSGLSNNIEQENPLLWYFSSFGRPFNPVTVKTSYKSHEATNQNDSATDLIRVDRFPFTRKDAKLDAQWEFDTPFSLNFGYRWQRWERGPEYWEGASTDEHSMRIGTKTSPYTWLNLSASYSQSLRLGTDYHFMEADLQQPKQLLLPKFSLSDRNSSRLDFTAEFIPTRDLNIAVNYGFSNDTYDKSIYGMIDGTSWTAGAAITWTPFSRLALNADYQHEEFITNQSSASISAGTFRANDTLDTVGVAMNFTLVPEKVCFVSRGSYSISGSDSGLGNSTGGTGHLTRMESFLRYRHSGRLSLRCGYMYEDYGAGQSGIAFRDPLTNNVLKSYSAHVALGVINYDF